MTPNQAPAGAEIDSDQNLRLLLDGLKDVAIFMLDGAGRVVTWNAGAERMKGYTAAEAIGQPLDIFYEPQDVAAGQPGQALAAAAANGSTREEGLRVRKDGSRFWAAVETTALRDESGALRGYASVTRDISERKQAEAAALEQAQRLRVLADATPNGLLIVAESGEITWANQRAEGVLFGYGPGQLDGRPVEQLVPSLFQTGHRMHRAAFNGDRQARAMGAGRDLFGRRLDGGEFPIEIGLNPIKTSQGRLTLASVVDISERKQSEEALRRANAELERRVAERTAELTANEAKLRTLFDVLPVGVSVLDQQRRVVDSNPALERIIRMSHEDLIAGAFSRRQYIRPDGTPIAPAELASQRAFDERRPVLDVEMGIVTDSGEIIWTNVSAAPLPVAGLGVVVVTTDITERKRTEMDLRAANAHLRFFVDANLIGVTRTDEYGNLIEANDYYLNVLGFNRQDFEAGRVNWLERTPPEYLELDARAVAELKAHGVSKPFEKEYIRRDGARAWVYLTNAMLPDGTIAAYVLDITERKRAEAALREGGERNRALLAEAQRRTQELTLRDMMHQALARELDVREVVRLLVEGIAQSFGYTLVSLYLLEGDTLKLQHQVGYDHVIDSVPITRGVSGRVVRSGQPVLVEDVRADPDFLGAIEGITSEICVPLFDQGQVAGILNLESTQGVRLTDGDLRLTLALGEQVDFALGRARLTRLARESQQRFASAFNYAAIGMALVAPDGRWLQVNPALCQLVGYTPDELLESSFQSITHPDDLETDLQNVRQVLAGTIPSFQMEKRYLHKQGRTVWALLSVSLVRDAQGGPLYFISQIQDITERKQAEQALARERDLMQALMDNIPDTIYFKDAASRFTRINRAQAEFLGLPDTAAALGHTDLDYLPPDFAQEVYAEEQSMLQTGQPVLNRMDRMQMRDEPERWFASTKVPLREGGRVVGMVGVSRDITALKQAEARLLASLQEKEVLLKEIHHRVKNNLQIVSSLLHLQAELADDPRLREAFDESQRRVRSMALIHEQLYRSSDLAHIDFAEYVSGLLDYLRRSQTRPGGHLPVRVEIDRALPLEIDRAIPLGLMVNELVTNCLKYAFPASRPPRETDEIWVAVARDAGGSLTVVVGDTGAGLPETLDLDHPASMGLQLVQSFVTQLRAKMSVQRQPGTVFRITIPERKRPPGEKQ